MNCIEIINEINTGISKIELWILPVNAGGPGEGFNQDRFYFIYYKNDKIFVHQYVGENISNIRETADLVYINSIWPDNNPRGAEYVIKWGKFIKKIENWSNDYAY